MSLLCWALDFWRTIRLLESVVSVLKGPRGVLLERSLLADG